MSTHQIKLYNLFRKELQLSDEKAADFVSAVDDAVGSENNSAIKSISTRVEALGEKVYVLGERVHGLGKRFDVMEYKFDVLENRFVKLENRFDTLEIKLDAKFDAVKEYIRTMDKRFNRTIYGATIWQLVALIVAMVTIMRLMK